MADQESNELFYDRMIEDLAGASKLANHPFDAWELEFIESVQCLTHNQLSKKQKTKIEDAWDKI